MLPLQQLFAYGFHASSTGSLLPFQYLLYKHVPVPYQIIMCLPIKGANDYFIRRSHVHH
jgi:hypothetical protein